jgi:tRNA 2-thiouridine synthesizing protein A
MKELDLKGLKCPLPVLRLRRFIRDHLTIGDQVEVSTTDPMSQLDIPHYCNESGQKLISSELNEDVCVFIVEKQIHINQNQ